LVDELLALARADTSGGDVGDVDLAAVAAERAAQWEPLASERGICLVAEGRGERVRAGRGRVAEVVDNLLANALDATPAGGTVRIHAQRRELHVIDDGAGLSHEAREHAFDRFWTAGKKTGSGLGLPIARRLVEADGGTIELRSSASGGVDAVVRF
jgi:signal transduction histidine kinase